MISNHHLRSSTGDNAFPPRSRITYHSPASGYAGVKPLDANRVATGQYE
ncbi:hypothetical protein [Erwinia mallotivora]|nr:hypothetical protein [Erwinia mallotivora]